jgi:hypothetical protein
LSTLERRHQIFFASKNHLNDLPAARLFLHFAACKKTFAVVDLAIETPGRRLALRRCDTAAEDVGAGVVEIKSTHVRH